MRPAGTTTVVTWMLLFNLDRQHLADDNRLPESNGTDE